LIHDGYFQMAAKDDDAAYAAAMAAQTVPTKIGPGVE
jgi:hypothetical protein